MKKDWVPYSECHALDRVNYLLLKAIKFSFYLRVLGQDFSEEGFWLFFEVGKGGQYNILFKCHVVQN